MGAFLFFKKENTKIEEPENQCATILNVFKEKQMPLKKRLDLKNFILYVYGKINIDVENVIQFDNENFIIGTGTYLYKNKIGIAALKELYYDFSTTGKFFHNIKGNYAIILFKEGKLYVFNDLGGLYHIYTNKNKSIISSSIIPITKYIKSLNILKQELYEYIITGAVYGDKTVFKEIELIDSRCIYEIHPECKTYSKPTLTQDNSFDNLTIDQIVDTVANELIEYFKIVKSSFGNEIITPITGGFDSRLMYSALKRTGIKPIYGFVLKKDHQKDVEIASQIAKEEKLTLKIIPNDFPNYREDKTLNILKEQFYLYDGLGIGGVFQFFSGLDAWKKLEYSSLLLDGGGGEIYRNMHRLPSHGMSIQDYILRVFRKKDLSLCAESFSLDDYYSNFSKKIQSAININNQQLTRIEAEKIFPLFYLKYWMGSVNSAANQFSYYLTPFADEKIVSQSLKIPIKYKYKGYFEGRLIKHLDVELSKIPSNYGFNFFDGISIKQLISEMVILRISPKIKSQLKVLLKYHKPKNNLPFYTQKNYIEEALTLDYFIKERFGLDNLEMSNYINFSKAAEPSFVSRALSVELLLQNKF